jgi:hypothetical protein
MREFYANLYRKAGDSFLTWVRGTEIHVTLDLISAIIRASRVRNPKYPWPVDHFPSRDGNVFRRGIPSSDGD